eukprot:gene11421-12547_t
MLHAHRAVEEAVEESKRQQLLSAHVKKLDAAERKALATAEADLVSLFRRNAVNQDSSWEEVCAMLAGKPGLQAVMGVNEQLRVFQDSSFHLKQAAEAREEVALRRAIVEAEARALEEIRLAEDRRLKEEIERSDRAFFLMLTEVDSPPIGSETAWPLVKPQIWRDERYAVVPEARRRAIFDAFLEEVKEMEVAVAQEAARSVSAATENAQTVAEYEALLSSLDTFEVE